MKNLLLALLLFISSNIFSQDSSQIVGCIKRCIEPSMVLVEGGTFEMGRNDSLRNERPAHQVTLKTFYIGKYEVTQYQWRSVMGSNLSGFKGCDDCPVENINWKSVKEYLAKLNKQTAKNYRLPTEAEWEYAASGGNQSRGYRYSGSNDPAEVGWYKPNAESKTHPVGLKKPNELGIYDMMGNVWELCCDWYASNYYKHSPANNPQNTSLSLYHVSRGGSWRSGTERCYNKARNRNIKDHHISNGGIRLALDK
jgi:formylglycine-generating enzyme required for sulfatase activity